MRNSLMVRSLLTLAVFLAASRTSGQCVSDYRNDRWLDICRNYRSGREDPGHACALRVVPVRLLGHAIEVDARENGSILVLGSDDHSVRVTARLQAYARDDAAARDLLRDLKFATDGGRVSLGGPISFWREHGSVTYVILVPRSFDLQLDASNGSLGVTGVNGKLDLRTANGSVNLAGVGGDVRVRTQNGSINLRLSGSKWRGAGLNAETLNGSVRLGIPESYAAQVDIATETGRVTADFPLTAQSVIGQHLTLPLNGGGTTLQVTTTNGSVKLLREADSPANQFRGFGKPGCGR
jgi:hypothetical protein